MGYHRRYTVSCIVWPVSKKIDDRTIVKQRGWNQTLNSRAFTSTTEQTFDSRRGAPGEQETKLIDLRIFMQIRIFKNVFRKNKTSDDFNLYVFIRVNQKSRKYPNFLQIRENPKSQQTGE